MLSALRQLGRLAIQHRLQGLVQRHQALCVSLASCLPRLKQTQQVSMNPGKDYSSYRWDQLWGLFHVCGEAIGLLLKQMLALSS